MTPTPSETRRPGPPGPDATTVAAETPPGGGGDYASVPPQLARWTNGGLPGLVNRRKAEGHLFKDGRYGSRWTDVPTERDEEPADIT